MAAQREEIMEALFQRLKAIPEMKFGSRVFQSWDDSPPAVWPAFFMVKGNESAMSQEGINEQLPYLWRISALVSVYIKHDKGRLFPIDREMNRLLSAFESALERKPDEPPNIDGNFVSMPPGGWGTSLGGLCYSARIAGEIDIFLGDIAGTGMMIFRVDCLTSA